MKIWETESKKLIPTIIGKSSYLFLKTRYYEVNPLGGKNVDMIRDTVISKLSSKRKMYVKIGGYSITINISWLS